MTAIAVRLVWPRFASTERAIAAFAVVLVLVGLTGADGLRTTLPAVPRTGDAATALPIAARGAISAALGRDQVSYHARPTQDGFAVDNARHDLEARFTADGMRVRAGATGLGLELGAWGYGEVLRPVAAATPEASANRVEYRRGPLTEWYVNGPLGLQQGFTLLAPPPRAGGALTLAVPFSGRLSPSLAPSGEGLTFEGSSLQYRDLIAFDAAGRELPAWLEVRGRTVLLRVEDRGALYPLTIDPFVQQAKLTASDGAGSDALGSSVAVSGDTVVVGAPTDDVGANANQGSAYVFVKPASGWASATETAKLTASDGAGGDQLGLSVAVSGDTVVAGALFDDVGANANQGSAYVFVKPASGWASATETAKLTASDGASGDELGRSVATTGDTIVAGARGDDGAAANQGSAYVFVKPASGWASATETAKLTASDGASGDELAFSVAVSGDTVVAGAWLDDAPAANQGSAYVFVKPASGWASATETAKLTASDGASGDELAFSVAVSGDDTVVAGAWLDDAPAANQGSAYVFARPASGWASATETAKLTASDGASGDEFGRSVSTSGDTVVVGAWLDDAPAANQGSAYVFVRPASGWASATQTGKLAASDGASGDNLGVSTAVSGDSVVVGAWLDDVGVNANQGSAYVFVKPASGWASATETEKLTASDGAGGDQFGLSVAVSGDSVVAGAPVDGVGSAYVFGPQVIVPPQVSIDDVAVAEGDSGTSDASFTVTLSEPSSQTVTVDFATADGTASAGSDYVAASGTLTFTPGDTSETVTVLVNGDTLDEPDETFFVNLSNPVNGVIVDGQGQGTIVNDEPLAPPGTLHDVGVAGGGFNTKGRVDKSRDGLGPFPVKIKVKNFGNASEDISYAVSSSEAGTVFSAACSGVVFDVPPNTAVLISGCTVTYADAADPDPVLTLTVGHNDGDSGTDSNPANNTDLKAIVINP